VEKAELDSFLAELNQEFGKPKRVKYTDLNAEAKDRNKKWHKANVPLEGSATSYAKAQLEKSTWRNFYDWQQHRMRVLQEINQEEGKGDLPDLDWYPDARVTYVIQQHCNCCHNVIEFVGTEFIRFHGRRRVFHELGGGSHLMAPIVLQPIDKVDPNLLMFGLADGRELDDLIEYKEESVRRCAGCIAVERQAYQLLMTAVEPGGQADLPGFDQVMQTIEETT
jgi:hypothetical protein